MTKAPTRVLTLWKDETLDEADTEVLRRISAELPIPLNAEGRKAVATLMEAFLERDDAVGLAAPQIGLSKRIIAFRSRGFDEEGASDGKNTAANVEILINPRITTARGDLVYMTEGCLSCPDVQVEVGRFPDIRVRAFDQHGKKISRHYLDFVARVVQHEMDHLDGKLIVDYGGPVFVPKKKRGLFEKLFADTDQ